MQSNSKQAELIWKLANEHLRKFDGVNIDMIDAHLYDYKNRHPKRLLGNEGLFYELVNSLQNQHMVPRVLSNIDEYTEILFDFNPHSIVRRYNDWEDIFGKIKKINKYKHEDTFIENKRSILVKFCKGVYSSAMFLSRFKDLNEFNDFKDGFLTNEYSRLALPLLLSKEIFFMGFALACNFLKETGNEQFVKPDIHLIDILWGLKIADSKNPYEVFKAAIVYANIIGEEPYVVDKAFWLIGSRKFYKAFEGKEQYRKHNIYGTDSKRGYIDFVAKKLSL